MPVDLERWECGEAAEENGPDSGLARWEILDARIRNSLHFEIAPWHILRADVKKRARLNCIAHLLSQFPYKELPREKVKLSKRNTKGA